LAFRSRAIVGEFERSPRKFDPTCDDSTYLQRLVFSDDGLVSVQRDVFRRARMYSYSVVDMWDGAYGLEMLFELTQLPGQGPEHGVVVEYAVDEDDTTTYSGILYYIAPQGASERRVMIPDFGIDVEDLPLLKQRGLDMQQVRLQALGLLMAEAFINASSWCFLSRTELEEFAGPSLYGHMTEVEADDDNHVDGLRKRGWGATRINIHGLNRTEQKVKSAHSCSRPRQQRSNGKEKKEAAMLRATLMEQALQKRRVACESRVRRQERNLRWS